VSEDQDLGVGDIVQVIPNHVCSTVNLHNEVYLMDEDGGVDRIEVSARGKLE
jgi:D-serine deaminase-like pyridoxal phosphate-dependent protein